MYIKYWQTEVAGIRANGLDKGGAWPLLCKCILLEHSHDHLFTYAYILHINVYYILSMT